MKHQLLALLALIASFLTANAYGFYSGGLCYDFNSDGTSVSVAPQFSSSPSYNAGDLPADLVIPSTVTYAGKTYTVTAIGDRAFWGCSDITSITIPNSVISIGNYAFYGCSDLTSVTIPKSVTLILKYAFSRCTGLTTVYWNAKKCSNFYSDNEIFKDSPFTNLIIGDEVEVIPDYFMYNPYIGNQNNVTNITLPNSVTTIGKSAFYGCYNLSDITFPNSVTYIGTDAFKKTAWFNNQPDGMVYAGLVAYKYKGTMPTGTDFVIPGGIKGIAGGCFDGCTGLKSITLPTSIVSIGSTPFIGCRTLSAIYFNSKDCNYSGSATAPLLSDAPIREIYFGGSVKVIPDYFSCNQKIISSITIPSSVTSIGKGAFYGCGGLTSISTGKSLTSIGDEAFYGCASLANITFPATLTSIGDEALRNCASLADIYSLPKCEDITLGSAVFNGVDKSACTLHVTPTNLNAYKTTAQWKDFLNISADIINLTYSINADGTTATVTGHDDDITGALTIPSTAIIDGKTYTVTAIGDKAFDGCSAMTSITIPNTISSIGWRSFGDCSGLISINIPKSLTSIGYNAFSSCSGLTTITVESGNPNYDSRNNCNAIIETQTNTLIKGCTSTVIPASVTSIADWAFYKFPNLASINIPKSVTSIGRYAFTRTGLTSITVESGNMKFDSRDNCNAIIETATNTILFGCKNTSIPKTVTAIGQGAFASCLGLTSITIPASITSIGQTAFEGCLNLRDIYLNSLPGRISLGTAVFNNINLSCTLHVRKGSIEQFAYAYQWKDFIYIIDDIPTCDLTVEGLCYNYSDDGNSVYVTFETEAFPHYASLSGDVSIPPTVTYDGKTYPVTAIGNSAFFGCVELTGVSIPNTIIDIEYGAFTGCRGITSLTIPASVKTINNAFDSCHGLKSIMVDEANTTFDSRDNCNAIILTESNCLTRGCQNSSIPATVTAIGEGAFSNCITLKSITIPASVTSIREGAFIYCSGLNDIYAYPDPAQVNVYLLNSMGQLYHSFLGVPTTTIIHVLPEYKETYASTSPWNLFNIVGDLTDSIPGDLNGDGIVNAGDISEQYSAILRGDNDPAFDVNGDGSINAGDISEIYRVILNQ